MAYDPTTADRVRAVLADRTDVEEKRIIGGGLGFMVGGQLCCAVTTNGMTVRVGATARDALLSEPHVVPHMVGKRQTAAFVVVEPEGLVDETQLRSWVGRGLDFVDGVG
jgi:hypothetical protein